MADFDFTPINKDATFKVALDQIEVADFRQVRGLTVTKEVLEYAEGGQNDHFHKLIGGTRHTPIELSFGSSSSTELYDWVKKALDGTIERKNGSIMALNQDGTVVGRWEFRGAWPLRYEGPRFDHHEGETAINKLVLAHSGFFFQKETDAEAKTFGGSQEGEGGGVSKGSDDARSAGEENRTQNVRRSCKKDGVEVWDDDEAGEYLDAHALSQGKDPQDVQCASVGNVLIIRPEHSDDPSMMRQEQGHIQQGRESDDDQLQSGEVEARDEAKKENLTEQEQQQASDEQAAVGGDPGYHP